MSISDIVTVGVGLSMDAFAVAVGMSSILPSWKERMFLAFLFGFFQFLMILLGDSFGVFFPFVSTFKNVLSFLLLFYVGIHMIIESFSASEYPPFSIFNSIFLAVATSIDAFCIGFGFSFYLDSIFLIACMIGIITFTLSTIGCMIGRVSQSLFHPYSEILGGILLIFLSFHFLLEHF